MLFFSVFNQFYVIFNHFFKLPVPSNYYRIVYCLYYSFMVANLKRKNILIIPENCIIRKKYIYQYHIFLHVKQTKLWLRNLKKNLWCDVEKVCLELEKEVGIRRVSKSAILINRAGHAYLYFQRVSVTAVSLTR